MLAGDDKNSVLCEVGLDYSQEIIYSPYGHSAGGMGALGFNGAVREAQVGWYLLGNGYRAFHPGLMRFCSPDSWSPFGEGGLNAYTYAMGDPVNYTDPTGHTILGAIARAFTVTTKSSVAEAIPAGLKMMPAHKTSARLFKISPQDVTNAEFKVGAFTQKRDFLSETVLSSRDKLNRAIARSKSTGLLEQKFRRDAIKFNKAKAQYDDAVSEYVYLRQNVGRKAITRHSSADLATYQPTPVQPQNRGQQFSRFREIEPRTQSQIDHRQHVDKIRRTEGR